MIMIRIGIYGYGHLGRGVEAAIKKNSDMKLVAVFTRRDPQTVKLNTVGVKVFPSVDVKSFVDDIDVMILCGGSATDLPLQTPELCKFISFTLNSGNNAYKIDELKAFVCKKKNLNILFY